MDYLWTTSGELVGYEDLKGMYQRKFGTIENFNQQPPVAKVARIEKGSDLPANLQNKGLDKVISACRDRKEPDFGVLVTDLNGVKQYEAVGQCFNNKNSQILVQNSVALLESCTDYKLVNGQVKCVGVKGYKMQ